MCVRSDDEEFDYIVVGAGAAGSAAASRLALAGHRTLLVEAGGDPSPLTKVSSTLFQKSQLLLIWLRKRLSQFTDSGGGTGFTGFQG